MRGLFAISFLFLLSGGLIAQDIPNGSFEDWGTASYPRPADWQSFGAVDVVSDATDGSKAIRLSNTMPTQGASIFGVVSNIDIVNNNSFVGGEPYDERPLTIKLDAKYDLAAGDTAQFWVVFNYKGNPLSIAQLNITGESNDTFTNYSIPIQWGVSTSPDSIAVVFTSRSLEDNVADGEGYVIFDNLRFQTFSTPNANVKNPSFELDDPHRIERPSGWYSTDMLFYELGAPTASQPLVAKSGIAKDGQYGVTLRAIKSRERGDQPAIIYSGNDMSAIAGGTLRPTIKLSQNWKYLDGWYKYDAQNDTAQIAVVVFRNGQIIGGMQSEFPAGNVSDWTYFSFPIQYAGGISADSATIVLSATNLEQQYGSVAELQLDQLSFTDVVSTQNLELESAKVFYTDLEKRVKVNFSQQNSGQIIARDVLGREAGRMNFDKEVDVELSASDWESGFYIIEIESIKGRMTTKIFKND